MSPSAEAVTVHPEANTAAVKRSLIALEGVSCDPIR
jgi:hypothetical protein